MKITFRVNNYEGKYCVGKTGGPEEWLVSLNKYISEDVSGINEVFETYDYVDDVKIVIDELVNAVNNSLKDEYFTSERVKMNVNGSEATVNKVTLLLNYENTKVLAIDILSYLQASNQFVESYSKITESNKSDIINDLQEEINTIKNDTNGNHSIIKVILYTKGFSNEFVGFEIITESENENVNFSVINDKKDTFTLLFEENYKDSEDVINGSVEIVDNKYNFTITNEEMVVKGSLVNEDNTFDIDVNYIFEGNEIGLDLSYLVKHNEKVTIPSLTNSVKFEDITSEEAYNMLEKVLNNDGAEALATDILEINGYDTSNGINVEDFFVSTDSNYNDDNICTDCIDDVSSSKLSYDELKKYNGTNKSYQEAYELLTKYYKNGASLISETMNGNVKIKLDLALDMEKASSHLFEPKNQLMEAANEYLDRNQTYTINVALQNDQNTVKITINSEKYISANEYFSNPENR